MISSLGEATTISLMPDLAMTQFLGRVAVTRSTREPVMTKSSGEELVMETTPLTVETFVLPHELKAKQRIALLAARGLDQERAEELCNSHDMEDMPARVDSSIIRRNFLEFKITTHPDASIFYRRDRLQ